MTRLEKQLEVIEMYKATFAKVGFETVDINFTNIDPKLINRLGQTCATYLREQENKLKFVALSEMIDSFHDEDKKPVAEVSLPVPLTLPQLWDKKYDSRDAKSTYKIMEAHMEREKNKCSCKCNCSCK